jgi:biotin carboxyl carrier protein
MKYEILINGVRRTVEFAPRSDGFSPLSATIDGRQVEADAVRIAPGVYSILIDGRAFEFRAKATADSIMLRTAGREFRVEIVDPRSWHRGRGGRIEMEGRQEVHAPMPGKIVRLLVEPGQHVELGQGLLVVEAMKMQNEIRSPKSGTVERLVPEGHTVNAGEVLAVIT